MLLVMDESGDPGLVLKPGQSPWLVVAGVLFSTREDGVACRAAMADLRAKNGSKEFHFTKNSNNLRRSVLDILAAANFRYYAVACDKSKLQTGVWKKPAALRHELAGRLTALVATRLVDCSVWFDTFGGKPTDRGYAKHIRTVAGETPDGRPRVKECRAFDSDKELLIQAADYICGAMAASLHTKGKGSDFVRTIRRQRGEVLVWP